MAAHLLEPAEQHWYCPECLATDVTRLPPGAVASRFHACPKLKGLTAPMVPEGVKARLEAREREDFVAGELVQTDGEGRPIMSVITHRDDGQDLTVYPPTATARST